MTQTTENHSNDLRTYFWQKYFFMSNGHDRWNIHPTNLLYNLMFVDIYNSGVNWQNIGKVFS